MVAPPENKKSTAVHSDDSANVRVVARIRPLSTKEKKEGSKETVSFLQKNTAVIQVQKKWFELDAAFGPESTQEDVYVRSGAANAVSEDLFKGFNCTILAYGQTGAGKTFSMGTAAGRRDGIQPTDGIIPRACVDLFRTIEEKCDGNAKVELSYLELYNEEIRDLFNSSKQQNLKIRENLNGEVYVHGITAKPVTSPAMIGHYMEEASKRRVVAATAMNAVSSRSHAICVLTISGVMEGPDGTDKFNSKLTLVDLAGSERIKKTGAQGARQTEGININKSLLVLGQVVSALSESGKRRRKPPYRDSKLTRLLQDSLGGNSRTIMVACVSPADSNLDETINTLRYASTARNIKNKATRNLVQNISPEEAAKLQRENQLLKQQVKELQDMLKRMSASTVAASREPSVISHEDYEIDDEKSTDDNIPRQIDTGTTVTTSTTTTNSNTDREKELEDEIEKLKKQLKNAREEAQKAIEVPALHLEITQLKEQVAESKQIAEENEELQRELADAKSDAESAQIAATYLSDIVESLKEIKRDEIDRKIQDLHQIEKEEHWIAFVQTMLENYKFQFNNLALDFDKKVVFAIDNLDFKEDQDTLLRKAIIERRNEERKKNRRRIWRTSSKSDDEEQIVIYPWKRATAYFKNRMKDIGSHITAETMALHDIRSSLEEEIAKLEREIGEKRLENVAFTMKNELVDKLTTMLIGTNPQPNNKDEDGSESSSESGGVGTGAVNTKNDNDNTPNNTSIVSDDDDDDDRNIINGNNNNNNDAAAAATATCSAVST